MAKNLKKLLGSPETRVLGDKAFAAISAVEGLRLPAASIKRMAALKVKNLTPAEKRVEILRAYAPRKGR